MVAHTFMHGVKEEKGSTFKQTVEEFKGEKRGDKVGSTRTNKIFCSLQDFQVILPKAKKQKRPHSLTV